ncbi:alpha/beta fold hydrolase [Ornithinimicrobium sediminis]|uniref:alpha/beta fold hydrolase n=1 Tax=Ornithinimicrobium sediminis TaxID=2904603 RepID=UPI001E4F6FE6|nr:alpha/beta hydrolase [Ornithinimicrobium sediminis]
MDEELRELLARRPDRTLAVRATDGVLLHVEVDEPAGGGAPEVTVVLSHGYTLDLRSWVYQRHALTAAGYRVVLWDQRGHGRSGHGDPAGNTIEQLGEDLHRVLDAVVPSGAVALVGHSMGGMTVMSYAADHPEQVRERVVAVALVSTSAGGMDRVRWGLGRLGALVNEIGPTVTARLAPRQTLLQRVRRRTPYLDEVPVAVSSFGSSVPRDVRRLTADMILDTDLAVMSAFAPALKAHDKREALAHLADVPLLAMVGDRDVLTEPLHTAEIVDALPHADHVVVQRAGHVIMLEHPEVVSEHLLDHLAHATGPHSEERSVQRHTVVDLRRGRGRRTLTLGRAR